MQEILKGEDKKMAAKSLLFGDNEKKIIERNNLLLDIKIFGEKNLRISVPRVPRCVPVRARSILREFAFPFRTILLRNPAIPGE